MHLTVTTHHEGSLLATTIYLPGLAISDASVQLRGEVAGLRASVRGFDAIKVGPAGMMRGSIAAEVAPSAPVQIATSPRLVV